MDKAESNRVNATFSTGPRTRQGKERSALNSTTHGFTAKRVIIPAGMEQEFTELKIFLEEDLVPEGVIQYAIFERLLHAHWNLRRIEAAELALFDGTTDPLTDPAKAKEMDRLQRYRTANERAMYRALNELRTLQTTRAQVLAEPELDGIHVSPLIKIRAVTKRSQTAASAKSYNDMSDAEMDQEVLKLCNQLGRNAFDHAPRDSRR